MGQYLTSTQIAALGTAQLHSQANPYPIPLPEIGLATSPYGELGNTPAPINFAQLPMQALAFLLHNCNFIKSEIEVVPFIDGNVDLSEFSENLENEKYIYRHLETNFNLQKAIFADDYKFLGVRNEQIEFWGASFTTEEAARESVRGTFIPFSTSGTPALTTEGTPALTTEQVPARQDIYFFEKTMNYDTYNSYSEIESYIYENTEALYSAWQQRLADWKTYELQKPIPNEELIADIDRQETYRSNARLYDLQIIENEIDPNIEIKSLDIKIGYANSLLKLADQIACKINFNEKLESFAYTQRSLLIQHEDVVRNLRSAIRGQYFYKHRNDLTPKSVSTNILSAKNLSFLKCYVGARLKPFESYSSESIPIYSDADIPAFREAEMALQISIPGVPGDSPEDLASISGIKIDYDITYSDPGDGGGGDTMEGGGGEVGPTEVTESFSSLLRLLVAPNVLALKKSDCQQRFHPTARTGWMTRFAIKEADDGQTFITGVRVLENEQKEYASIQFADLFDPITGEDRDENQAPQFYPPVDEWKAATDYVKYVPAVGSPNDPDYEFAKIDASSLRQMWQPYADLIKEEYQRYGTPDTEPPNNPPSAAIPVEVGSLKFYNKYEQLISEYPIYALQDTIEQVNIKYQFSDEYINAKYDWIDDTPVAFFNQGGGDTLDGGGDTLDGGGDTLDGGGGDTIDGGL